MDSSDDIYQKLNSVVIPLNNEIYSVKDEEINEDENVLNGAYVLTNNSISSNSAYSIAYVPVIKGKVYSLLYKTNTPNKYPQTFFSKNAPQIGDKIDSKYIISFSGENESGEIVFLTPMEDGYLCCSFQNNIGEENYNHFLKNIISVADKVSAQTANFTTAQDGIDKVLKLDNPIYYIGDEISILGKGIGIGDSLTEGVIDCNQDGSIIQGYIDEYYKWPAILSRMTGIEIVNKGHGGTTSKTYWEQEQNEDWSGFRFAIIWLGYNDQSSHQGDSYAGHMDEEQKRGYTNIINKLKNENKGIKIFCATIPDEDWTSKPNSSWWFTNVSNDIRTLASENGCYIVDFNKYWEFGQATKKILKNGSVHYNAAGYYTVAKMFKAYISYIIRTNIEDFKNMHFVGTDYIPADE